MFFNNNFSILNNWFNIDLYYIWKLDYGINIIEQFQMYQVLNILFGIVSTILEFLIIVLPLLIAVAYFTLAERKIMSVIQRRKGPNVVGFLGLLTPLADGLKLIVKETILPSSSEVIIFVLAPIITFALSLMIWVVIPYSYGVVFANLHLGLLYIFAISALGVHAVIMAGWASNSKYAFLGCLRTAAQMISYEIAIGLILLSVVICSNSFNLTEIVLSQSNIWYVFPHFPIFVMFFVSALAETNRHPFDLPEAESELVSGYNVEYSAATFALFFLGEYANMIFMSGLTVILFLGGWFAPIALLSWIPGSFWFGIKLVFFVVLFIFARAVYPRYRYDQLMRLGWKVFLPFSFSWLILVAGVLYLSDYWVFFH